MNATAEIPRVDERRLNDAVRRGKELVAAAVRRDLQAGANGRANPHCRCCHAWADNVGECLGRGGMAEPEPCWREEIARRLAEMPHVGPAFGEPGNKTAGGGHEDVPPPATGKPADAGPSFTGGSDTPAGAGPATRPSPVAGFRGRACSPVSPGGMERAGLLTPTRDTPPFSSFSAAAPESVPSPADGAQRRRGIELEPDPTGAGPGESPRPEASGAGNGASPNPAPAAMGDDRRVPAEIAERLIDGT